MHSYPKIWAHGHGAMAAMAGAPVVIEEKVDGSQFSFQSDCGRLTFRSKGADVPAGTTNQLFKMAVETVHRLADLLHDGWTYRAEAITRPKHNVLAYGRIPAGGLILFDVDRGLEDFLEPMAKVEEAQRLGLECVPLIDMARLEGLEQLKDYLKRESCLGGCNIEGVVMKAYGAYGRDGKTLMAKYVSSEFKEAHRKDWIKEPRTAFLERLGQSLGTPARYRKALQGLKESGEATDTPKDIGRLIALVREDVLSEEHDTILQALWDHFQRDIEKYATQGVPQWYKDLLVVEAIENPQHAADGSPSSDASRSQSAEQPASTATELPASGNP